MATAPAVTETTADIYDELPETFRTQDEPLGWPLLRYLACLGDQADEVIAQLRLMQAGAMGDPVAAPPEWLDWMAQFVALRSKALTAPQKRAAILAGGGMLAGSLDSVDAAVTVLLGGQQRFLIATHDGGDPFVIRIYVNADDAGGTTWDSLALRWPSWNAWEAAGTWDNLAVPAPILGDNVLNAVKPAWLIINVEAIGSGLIWLFLEQNVTTWTQWEAQFPTWDSLETAVLPWP